MDTQAIKDGRGRVLVSVGDLLKLLRNIEVALGGEGVDVAKLRETLKDFNDSVSPIDPSVCALDEKYSWDHGQPPPVGPCHADRR